MPLGSPVTPSVADAVAIVRLSRRPSTALGCSTPTREIHAPDAAIQRRMELSRRLVLGHAKHIDFWKVDAEFHSTENNQILLFGTKIFRKTSSVDRHSLLNVFRHL
jgi:hypothetical protein